MTNSKRATISDLDQLMDGIEDFMLTQDQSATSEDTATMPLSPPEEQASQRPESHAAAVAW